MVETAMKSEMRLIMFASTKTKALYIKENSNYICPSKLKYSFLKVNTKECLRLLSTQQILCSTILPFQIFGEKDTFYINTFYPPLIVVFTVFHVLGDSAILCFRVSAIPCFRIFRHSVF